MRNWLRRWLGIERLSAVVTDDGARLSRLSKDCDKAYGEFYRKLVDVGGLARLAVTNAAVADLEREVLETRTELFSQIEEIRERLDMPQKKKASGRPFPQLRRIAEMGEAVRRANGE